MNWLEAIVYFVTIFFPANNGLRHLPDSRYTSYSYKYHSSSFYKFTIENFQWGIFDNFLIKESHLERFKSGDIRSFYAIRSGDYIYLWPKTEPMPEIDE